MGYFLNAELFLGSKFSFDPSVDESSSLVESRHGGSKRSLAGTSVTSTADLSVFSSATRSQAQDNSLDAQSLVSDTSSGRDVLRIYVPYTPPAVSPLSSPRRYGDVDAATPTPRNGDVYTSPSLTPTSSPPRSLFQPPDNRIRIKVDISQDDVKTPVVEFGQFIQRLSPELNSS